MEGVVPTGSVNKMELSKDFPTFAYSTTEEFDFPDDFANRSRDLNPAYISQDSSNEETEELMSDMQLDPARKQDAMNSLGLNASDEPMDCDSMGYSSFPSVFRTVEDNPKEEIQDSIRPFPNSSSETPQPQTTDNGVKNTRSVSPENSLLEQSQLKQRDQLVKHSKAGPESQYQTSLYRNFDEGDRTAMPAVIKPESEPESEEERQAAFLLRKLRNRRDSITQQRSKIGQKEALFCKTLYTVNGTNSTLAKPKCGRSNTIKLHVYDLISKDALIQLPGGILFEIGKVFSKCNSALHELGTGAYHVGIEVNGIEYAYGGNSSAERSGVFSCIPTMSPGYQHRQTIDFGERELVKNDWIVVDSEGSVITSSKFLLHEKYIDGKDVMKEMTKEYMGSDYDMLRKNCCSFALDACLRLGVKKEDVPTWFRNLAESGAFTQDLALATMKPFNKVMSKCKTKDTSNDHLLETTSEAGFELIAKRNESDTMDVVVVADATPATSKLSSRRKDNISASYRRAMLSAH